MQSCWEIAWRDDHLYGGQFPELALYHALDETPHCEILEYIGMRFASSLLVLQDLMVLQESGDANAPVAFMVVQ